MLGHNPRAAHLGVACLCRLGCGTPHLGAVPNCFCDTQLGGAVEHSYVGAMLRVGHAYLAGTSGIGVAKRCSLLLFVRLQAGASAHHPACSHGGEGPRFPHRAILSLALSSNMLDSSRRRRLCSFGYHTVRTDAQLATRQCPSEIRSTNTAGPRIHMHACFDATVL